MSEKLFVEQLRRSARSLDKHAFIWKTNDRFSLGIPDLFIVVQGTLYGIEAKSTEIPREEDGGREVLKHPFSGPQISVLRQIERAGAFACGVVKVADSLAYIIRPRDIQGSGNFTLAEMEEAGTKVSKENGIWRITEWPTILKKGS